MLFTVYVCIDICVCMYICIEREREEERKESYYTYISVMCVRICASEDVLVECFTCMYVYMYVCIYV